jgi:hypothetical protein
MLGAAADDDDDDAVPPDELELELEPELPQPAINAAAARVGTIARFQPSIEAVLLGT